MATRWTPLVLRGLFCGATRFNDIHASVPRMSSALLVRRLGELERRRVIERRRAETGKGWEYLLTDAGRELFPVLEMMGMWSQRWAKREIVSDRNRDPGLLMWELRRIALNSGRMAHRRRVVQFELDGVLPEQRYYWLVFEPQDVDVCLRDPGFEIDLWIRSSYQTLIEVWMGHRPLEGALRDRSLRLDGKSREIKAFREWFTLSPFAAAAG
ncbi:MAG: winged helix-turn-helix transcriptional regulator [Burkholderiaceae bacterium]